MGGWQWGEEEGGSVGAQRDSSLRSEWHEGRRKGGTRTALTGMTGGSATLRWEWHEGSGGNDTTGGAHLFVLFVSGGSCLELIRFGNRIREGLIDFVPEID